LTIHSPGSRNVRTAPSTPEFEAKIFPRHAESTSNLEMTVPISNNSSKKQTQNDNRSSDTQAGPKSSPQKQRLVGDKTMGKTKKRKRERSPKMNKSRNEKFHKIFSDIAPHESVLNTYSCAYFGDILLQGYLYISKNWFCFYSKILGHAKIIRIPVSKVLNITREKTAFIIPNAIGIRTPEDKYVFGSLMSRDNTYKLMWHVWKQARNETVKKLNVGFDGQDSVPSEFDISASENNNNKPKLGLTPNTSYDTDDEEDLLDEDDESESDDDDSDICLISQASTNLSMPQQVQNTRPAATGNNNVQPTSHNQDSPQASDTETSLLTYIDFKKLILSVFHLVKKVLSLPRSNLLLALCTLLSALLVISAVILSYKVLVLQARIDGAALAGFPNTVVNSDSLPMNVYYLNNQYHAATIEKFHNVLRANIQVLGQVHQSLKSLQSSPFINTSKDCPLPADDTKT
jgi:hypothetical protein